MVFTHSMAMRTYAAHMKTKFILVACLIAFSHSRPTRACGATPQLYAQWALSTNAARASNAVTMLRTMGHEGLQALLTTHEQLIAKHDAKDLQWQKLRAALDTVGGQRDCYASRLFWHTNFDSAKAEAQRAGKPILSLRLLGNLDEELSCANSRFFRTTLYANKEVSDYLREHFVLHWKSVRPVPHITIDMGDGRKIERTITGNSIHYILDAEGNPIDALPGLYGAKAFLAELDRAVAAEHQASELNGMQREQFLVNYHSIRLAEIQKQWSIDLARINQPAAPMTAALIWGSTGAPDAIAAAARAYSKTGVEAPLLRSGAESPLSRDINRVDANISDSAWQKIAALHSDDAAPDAGSTRLIQFKQPPTAAEATRVALTKAVVETPAVRMLRNLQRSIAEDTVHNEYQLHSRIHEWFANGTAPTNLDALNSKIYADLFLTPNSDSWLGLAPADTYSALDGGGLVQTQKP